jgi:hypothetical protein
MHCVISFRAAAAGALAVAVLAACSTVTDGTGTAGSAATASGSASHAPDFPSTTPSAPSAVASASAGATASTGPSPSGPSSTAPPSADQRRASLAATTHQQVSELVAVPGGDEAASFDQRGGIRFWFGRRDALTWTPLGSSRYPYVRQLGAPHAQVTGALLRNMRHATFVAVGIFTGDGSGNAVAFTDGPRGWGAIKAEANGNIAPSGRPVGQDQIGLSYGFALRDGYLVTADCSANRPISDCDTHHVTKRWVWTGREFRRA